MNSNDGNARKKSRVSVEMMLPDYEFHIKRKASMDNMKILKSWSSLETKHVGNKASLEVPPASRIPIFMGDIQKFICYMIDYQSAPCVLRWMKVKRASLTKINVIIVIEDISLNDIISVSGLDDSNDNMTLESLQHVLPCISERFSKKFEFISPIQKNLNFMEELMFVPLGSEKAQILNRQNAGKEVDSRVLFKSYKIPVSKKDFCKKMDLPTKDALNADQAYNRTSLLLNAKDLYVLNYPLNVPACLGYDDPEFRFSKSEYKEVTENSPMFGIDCEMIKTTGNVYELARISIVDEHHRVVYTSFVNPFKKVIQYPKQSGVTSTSLEKIKTRLKDVQDFIIENLPPDAIFVGHALSNDLRALKLFHPYIIDTSLIFNLCGHRNQSPSLKTLAKLCLNEDIQMGTSGHNPTEDALASIKLAQLKLSKDHLFTDAVKGYYFDEFLTSFSEEIDGDKRYRHISLLTEMNTFPEASILHTTLFGKKTLSGNIPLSFFEDHVSEVENFKEVKDKTIQSVKDGKKIIISHFKMEEVWHSTSSREEKLKILKKIDKNVKEIFDNVPEKTLVSLLFSGSSLNTTEDERNNGIFMMEIPNSPSPK